jgi:hypothetical protein
LGDSGAALLHGALSDRELQKQGKIRLHLEADGKLIYAEGRRLSIDEKLSVTAFVLYDMSGQQEKLLLQLERAAYRSESRGTALTLAVFEDRTEPGLLYRELKAHEQAMQFEPGTLSVIDAFTCACVFTGKQLRSLRYLLKNVLCALSARESVRAALHSYQIDGLDDSPAQSLIDCTLASMLPFEDAFKPELLVVDPYPAVIESLELIAGDIVSLQLVQGLEDADSKIRSGEYDGIFLDIETYADGALDEVAQAVFDAGAGFQIYYMSHKQPAMVYLNNKLSVDSTVFQKPFDANAIRSALLAQFDFA